MKINTDYPCLALSLSKLSFYQTNINHHYLIMIVYLFEGKKSMQKIYSLQLRNISTYYLFDYVEINPELNPNPNCLPNPYL